MAAPPADPAPAAPHSLPPPGTAGSRRPLHVSTKHLERVPQARAQGGAGGRCGPGTAASPPPSPGCSGGGAGPGCTQRSDCQRVLRGYLLHEGVDARSHLAGVP
ncbi:myosin IC heavy chain-like [Canis lupus dingo]|uniref:myosin IC heavy chain-like n=1 Tax=Canis lupus dingo TaxID=286419 RepID=UPI0018F675C1|nr:myosin IC heavy chain-like [Canis lupus dingo]